MADEEWHTLPEDHTVMYDECYRRVYECPKCGAIKYVAGWNTIYELDDMRKCGRKCKYVRMNYVRQEVTGRIK